MLKSMLEMRINNPGIPFSIPLTNAVIIHHIFFIYKMIVYYIRYFLVKPQFDSPGE